MSLSIIRIGELAYHALDFQSQTQDDWVNYFKSKEEVEAMFTHEDCSIYTKIPDPDVTKEAEKALNKALSKFDGKMEQVVEQVIDHSVQSSTATQNAQTVNQQQTVFLPQVVSIMVLSTDKGSFFHLDSWKDKLSEVYQHLDGFQQIFADACLEAGVDPTLDYISEVKKKAVAGKLKKCAKAYIDKLTDEA